MALRFRTRLTLTISSLVFLVVTVMTFVILIIFGVNMWEQNWRAGEVMTQVTTVNIEQAMRVPPLLVRRIEEQMALQARLAAEVVELAETSGESTDAIRARFERILGDVEDEGSYGSTLSVTVLDGDGNPQVRAGNPIAGTDAETGALPSIEKTLAHRPGAVRIDPSEAELREAFAPFTPEAALNQFMVGGQYTRMAIIAADGTIIAQTTREDVATAPQSIRRIVRLATNFIENMPAEGFQVEFMGRDVGVVTPLVVEEDEPPLALYVEHDTSSQWRYLADRLGVLVTVGFLMFMFALLVSIFLSRGLSKPLTELAKGAREFGAGNLNYRLRLRRNDEFNDLAQSFNTMAISIQEYVHELRQETSRRERLESEFRIAADMQKTLLPDAPPQVDELKLIGWSQPSKEVGGDFYDYFEMPDGKIAVVLGDATGKGLPAALMSTECASILRTLAGQNFPPGELLRRTNNEFFKRIGATHRFVTLMLLVVDVERGTATYASAGHPPPILANPETGETTWLESDSGYPLGIVKDAQFSEATVSLSPRDTIVIYSDGMTEAQNDRHELFGEDRLESCVRSHVSDATEALLDDLRAGATRHMDGREPIDDMTLVIVRFHPLVQASMPPA